jgi:hypothetical protein
MMVALVGWTAESLLEAAERLGQLVVKVSDPGVRRTP